MVGLLYVLYKSRRKDTKSFSHTQARGDNLGYFRQFLHKKPLLRYEQGRFLHIVDDHQSSV